MLPRSAMLAAFGLDKLWVGEEAWPTKKKSEQTAEDLQKIKAPR